MKPLNKIGDIDLDLPTLIEASAGTGKTYTLEELYVRALREVDGAKVESVLVVTFTNAAAAELRGRLRARLMKERDATAGDAAARQVWTEALLTFDKANITTIHGFCERMLSEFAFEGALPFGTEQEGGTDSVADEMLLDYWRRSIYSGGMSSELAEIQDAPNDSISGLAKEALARPLAKVQPGMTLDDLALLIGRFAAAMPNDFMELGINKTDKRIETFNNLKAMFRDPNWNGLHVLLKQAKIVGATGRFITKNQANHLFTSLLLDVRDSDLSLKAVMSDEAAKLLANPDARGVTPVTGRRRAEGMRTFDDMLNDLRLTLETSEAAVREMRSRFKIAMIDEFQDTDPVQWSIFRKLFLDGEAPHRIILVGDPKQAIYSFRGGDIDTYCRVRDEIAMCGEVYTMGTNYRSEPAAVDAVNKVFTSRPGTPMSTFNVRDMAQGEGISYNHVSDRTSDPAVDSIEILQPAGEAALPDPSDRESGAGLVVKLAGGDYEKLMRRDMVSEIRTLMDPGKWRIFRYERGGDGAWSRNDGRAIVPGDIMVLAATKASVTDSHGLLCLNSIPCTMRSDKSVFEEVEAQWMLNMMTVALEHGSRGLGALLSTPMFGCGADMIFDEVKAESDGEFASSMREALDVWRRNGLQGFFVEVSRRHGIRGRLLSAPMGERHWTNLSQIVEILSAAESAGRLTPEGVRAMLEEHVGGNYKKADAYEFRLDSDEESAVAMTTHKSKGLQAPIVFVMKINDGVSFKGARGVPLFVFHENGETLITANPRGNQKELVGLEKLEEAIRQFYVSVTRAKHRTYIYVDQADFPREGDGANDKGKEGKGVLGHIAKVSEVSGEIAIAANAMTSDVTDGVEADAAAQVVGGSIVVAKPGAEDSMPVIHGVRPASDLMQPPKASPQATPWVQGSFSWLKGIVAADSHEAPRQEDFHDDEPAGGNVGPDMSDLEAPVPLRYTMPGGPVFGNAVHTIFEICPFDADVEAIRGHSVQCLKAWGLESTAANPQYVDAVAEMVRDTLDAEVLDADGGTLRLADILPAARLAETTFHFPVAGFANISKLVDVLRGWGGIYAQAMEGAAGFSEASISGMMKGIIDLIVEHRGKYYIFDWKTNIIDGKPSSFAIDAAVPESSGMAREIANAMYPLQWALYALAVHRHLRSTVRGYKYETHFGGVRYMFLRGVASARPGDGIWVQPPPSAEQMEELDTFFSGATQE